jgi:hypothetical protein
VEVVATLPATLVVEAGGRRLRVVPLAQLLVDDLDVAELAGRAR